MQQEYWIETQATFKERSNEEDTSQLWQTIIYREAK